MKKTVKQKELSYDIFVRLDNLPDSGTITLSILKGKKIEKWTTSIVKGKNDYSFPDNFSKTAGLKIFATL